MCSSGLNLWIATRRENERQMNFDSESRYRIGLRNSGTRADDANTASFPAFLPTSPSSTSPQAELKEGDRLQDYVSVFCVSFCFYPLSLARTRTPSKEVQNS